MNLFEWLKLPETRHIQNLDAPSTVLIHRAIIRKKFFLRQIYVDFYTQCKYAALSVSSPILIELGSGGGFLKDVLPEVVTSDVLPGPAIDLCLSAAHLPFQDSTVGAFMMIDVFHHLADVAAFFRETQRCLRTGGKIVMIEPANTWWGRWIWSRFHHEPFDPSGGWKLQKNTPLSSANIALPYIVFWRDRERFEREFPTLQILKLQLHTPFRYILSGGVSMRQLLPDWMYPVVRGIERILSPLNKYLGMFLTIEIQKVA